MILHHFWEHQLFMISITRKPPTQPGINEKLHLGHQNHNENLTRQSLEIPPLEIRWYKTTSLSRITPKVPDIQESGSIWPSAHGSPRRALDREENASHHVLIKGNMKHCAPAQKIWFGSGHLEWGEVVSDSNFMISWNCLGSFQIHQKSFLCISNDS